MEKCSQCNSESNNLIPIARKGARSLESITTKYICTECLAKSQEYKECESCSDNDRVAFHIEDLNPIKDCGSIIYLCNECLQEYIEEREPASEEESDGINDLLEYYN